MSEFRIWKQMVHEKEKNRELSDKDTVTASGLISGHSDTRISPEKWVGV